MEKIIDKLIDEQLKAKNEEAQEEERAFSENQKCAILKAVLYMISADNVITNEERSFFYKLCKTLKVGESMVKRAVSLSDDMMFTYLEEVNKNQSSYINYILTEAAKSDNDVAPEEDALKNMMLEYAPKGKKPENFYNKLLNF